MDQTIFFQLQLGQRQFSGLLSGDGPTISSTFGSADGVALGHAISIKQIDNEAGVGEWWIVKYTEERRVNLCDLSLADITRLADAFGIRIRDAVQDHHRDFFNSLAFTHLLSWCQEHPTLAKGYGAYSDYLPDWYKRVTQAQGVPADTAAVH